MCDIVEISFKALKETIVSVLEFFVSGDKLEKQETQAKISISGYLNLTSPFAHIIFR